MGIFRRRLIDFFYSGPKLCMLLVGVSFYGLLLLSGVEGLSSRSSLLICVAFEIICSRLVIFLIVVFGHAWSGLVL